ncbi:troponin I, fast skeletal muscle-like isoform X1 [Oncorhynchus tshawytscha]|uniref:troponin I, fast skeletal muscle-like isoform X1 n=3 Tax=Oncorhynchus tshawytscha TaxID=74940 RepID=UPI001C3D220E|nr:troponin I, fast skeletal muscle-like isoform X1 [Oncorhynchus tshawytscha]
MLTRRENQPPAKMSDKKMSSSRRQHLKSLMLQIAQGFIEAEAIQAEEDKNSYMDENVPSLSVPGSMQELQIEDLKIKLQDLKGKFRKPVLKKVRMSADAMLQALLGSKHKVSMDLRSNLKQVKKEVKEEVKDAADWRKNIEDKAGMDGRKKMFESDP